jgi:hypothetical protein
VRQLADFEGVWRFERRVTEAGGGLTQVTGRAVWTRDGAGLVCEETGEMRVPGHAPMQVMRRTLWGPGLCVAFEDGRPFHTVPPGGGAVAHWCDPDQYDGDYDFGQWPDFRVVWHVKGPRKDYQMVTEYRREGS